MDEATRTRLPERIHAQIEDNANGCWEWTGHCNEDGYGRVKLGDQQLAHRVVWLLLVGEIPDGLTLDHLCCSPAICPGGRTCPHRRCVNPDHLTPATVRDNVLRGNGITAQAAAADACKRGHKFTPENTYRRPDRATRSCRECQRERGRVAYWRGQR